MTPAEEAKFKHELELLRERERLREKRINLGNRYTGRFRTERPPLQYVHPKDKPVPGFTHDSHGNPKPTRVDKVGLGDYIGQAMFGDEWQAKKRQAERTARLAHATRFIVSLGCLVILGLLMIAMVLGLIWLIVLIGESL